MRSYAPDAVAEQTGRPRRDHPAHRRRTGPRRLRTGDRDRPALDRLGRPPATTASSAGRSACMRCAASRPIPTASTPAAPSICCRCCWAPSIRPGGFRYKPPFPRPAPPPIRPGGKPGQVAAESRCRARRSASRKGRRICWSRPTARRARIDKAFSWEAPLAAHGLMHMVIPNAMRAIPTRSTRCSCTWRTWLELGDEHRRHDAHADRQGSGDRRRTRSRTSSIPTPIYSEMVAYADLVLPDTTYLER